MPLPGWGQGNGLRPSVLRPFESLFSEAYLHELANYYRWMDGWQERKVHNPHLSVRRVLGF